MEKYLIGTTKHFTFTSTGNAFNPIFINILTTNSDTLITSMAMTSSGSGYYSDVILPTTPGFYVAHWEAYDGSYPYKSRVRFQTVKGNVT